VALAGLAALGLLAAAVAVGAAAASRGGGAGGFSATVVPARADLQTGQAGQVAQGAADSRSPAAGQGAPGAVAQGQAAGSAVVAPSCSTAPTVQFQGRGLVVTGVAPVRAATSPATVLTISVQERAGDAATVIANAQAKVHAVTAALLQAGVPAANVQQSSFSSFGDLGGRQFSAYATIQAQVESADQLAQATRAVLQLSGLTGYSTSSSLASTPTSQEVQDAVSASGQARDMAEATARTAGVSLGSVQGVTAQPPAVCYGFGGPARTVQVTLTYALR